MSKLTRVAGFVWAAPLTLVGLIYATLFTGFGWYRRTGTFGDALVWNANIDKVPKWVSNTLLWWGGHSIGNVIVLVADPKSDRVRVILRHEQEHVRQQMVLGIFQPILYGLASLGLRFSRYGHHHYDNPFEIDARRAACQVIDVQGTLKRLVAQSRARKAAAKPS